MYVEEFNSQLHYIERIKVLSFFLSFHENMFLDNFVTQIFLSYSLLFLSSRYLTLEPFFGRTTHSGVIEDFN